MYGHIGYPDKNYFEDKGIQSAFDRFTGDNTGNQKYVANCTL